MLIDGDLRSRGLTRSLAGSSGGGLVEAIMGEKHWPSYVRVDRSTQLAILPASGKHFAHTSELLSGPGMQQLIKEALKEWLDEKWATFGKWSAKGIAAMILSVLAYIWLTQHGWRR